MTRSSTKKSEPHFARCDVPFDLLSVVQAVRSPDESILGTSERILIRQAYFAARGNQQLAAMVLGISKRTMNYRMRKYGLRRVDGAMLVLDNS
jgi:DNA-binding NtrC family response regulator